MSGFIRPRTDLGSAPRIQQRPAHATATEERALEFNNPIRVLSPDEVWEAKQEAIKAEQERMAGMLTLEQARAMAPPGTEECNLPKTTSDLAVMWSAFADDEDDDSEEYLPRARKKKK